MKNRAFVVSVFLLGTFVSTPLAHGDPTIAPKNPRATPYQGNGPDISQGAWQSWQAPVGTVDPDRLISDDSTNSTAGYHFDSIKSDSFQLANASNKGGKPIQVERTKPIEIESENTEPVAPPNPVLATATPKPKSDSKRIIMVAVISVAVLGYRKFRRANTSPYPPKPNFL